MIVTSRKIVVSEFFFFVLKLEVSTLRKNCHILSFSFPSYRHLLKSEAVQKCISNFDTPYLREKKSYRLQFFFKLVKKSPNFTMVMIRFAKKNHPTPWSGSKYEIFRRQNMSSLLRRWR